MKYNLFLCNSVYQILVVLWFKYHHLKNEQSDIIISNHMNGGKHLSEMIYKTGLFNHVYYAETLEEARYKVTRNRIMRFVGDVNPIKELEQYIKITCLYTDLYIANCDVFSQMLYNAMTRKMPELKLHFFEDGLSTYSEFEKYYRSYENFYYSNKKVNCIIKFMRRFIYKKKTIYGNVKDFFVFNPEIMRWDPGCPIRSIDKIDVCDTEFLKLINEVFSLENSVDKYDCKYIFLEESFFADGEKITDVELVDELAKKIGKENIMIKIHPRNPVNRFSELGYKTNKDTSVPWEVILLNLQDVSEKVFLTVASSAILNPIMVFGAKITAYSLYPCLEVIPERLKGNSWAFIEEMFSSYPEMITLCDDINSIR